MCAFYFFFLATLSEGMTLAWWDQNIPLPARAGWEKREGRVWMLEISHIECEDKGFYTQKKQISFYPKTMVFQGSYCFEEWFF